jgi:hypothetical protein
VVNYPPLPPPPTHRHHHWQNSPFWAIAILRRSCQNCRTYGFRFVGLRNSNFLQCNVVSLASNLQSLYLYPPVTVWPIYTPMHRVPFLSPPTTGCSERKLIGLSFYRRNFLRKSCATCREKYRRRLIRLLSPWCSAAALFSASGAELS